MLHIILKYFQDISIKWCLLLALTIIYIIYMILSLLSCFFHSYQYILFFQFKFFLFSFVIQQQYVHFQPLSYIGRIFSTFIFSLSIASSAILFPICYFKINQLLAYLNNYQNPSLIRKINLNKLQLFFTSLMLKINNQNSLVYMAQRIPQNQQNQKGIPLCQVCKQDCVPESSQSIIFILTELLLLFISIKLSIITLFIGYSFCKTDWNCPICGRRQQIHASNTVLSQEIIEANKNLIFRKGKCMVIMSIIKFRILSLIICSLIIYWYFIEKSGHKDENHINRSWNNLVRDCGYQTGLQNSFRANQYFQKYSDQSQQWNLEGVYLETFKSVKSLSYVKIKMQPTQFSDINTEDIILITQNNNLAQKPQKGDIVQFTGFFQGRQQQAFRFVALQFHKTSRKKLLQQIQTFTKKSLRENS